MNQKLNPRRLLVVVMFILSAPGCSAANAGESVQLVVDSRPRATILLAEKPTASAQLAAYELQHYIQKISGAKLPIVREPARVEDNRILVGHSKAAKQLGCRNEDFAEQEYTIRTFPEVLLLAGYDRQYFE